MWTHINNDQVTMILNEISWEDEISKEKLNYIIIRNFFDGLFILKSTYFNDIT